MEKETTITKTNAGEKNEKKTAGVWITVLTIFFAVLLAFVFILNVG